MKNTNPPGLFDDQYLLEKLTKLKDPLVKLNEHMVDSTSKRTT